LRNLICDKGGGGGGGKGEGKERKKRIIKVTIKLFVT
jgi:hypothetical protein